MKKLKVYVGCALTHAPQEYKDMIADFKDWLRNHNWIEVLDFVGALEGKPQADDAPAHIYKHDIHNCVMRAHVVVGEISYPSLGLGWELATIIEKKRKLTIMLAQQSALVSKLPQGAVAHNKHAVFYRYVLSLKEINYTVLDMLQKEHKKINQSLLEKWLTAVYRFLMPID